MKKSMILAAMLSVGYAAAQNEYDGRVGINTTTPSATLNVKSKDGSTSSTKNVELQNKNGQRLVTVLDNGNVGIGARNATEEVALADVEVADQTTGLSTDTHRYNRLNIAFPGERRSILFQGNSTSVGTYNKQERMSSRMRYTWYDASADIGMIRGASAWIAGLAINFNDVEKIRFHKDGRIGINTSAPTHTLHIKPEGDTVEPLKVEGLKASTATTDKVLVADANGVVKTAERSAIGGVSLDAITGGVRTVTAITAEEWTKWTKEGTEEGVDANTAGAVPTFALIQTSDAQVILPAPADYKGRIIAVNNQSGTTLNFGANNPKNYSTIESGGGFLLISNGSRWYVIGGGI